MNLTNYYQSQLKLSEEKLILIKKQYDNMGLLRLGLLVIWALLMYFFFTNSVWIAAFIIVAGLAAFYFLVKKHESLEEDVNQQKQKIQLLENELGVLNGETNVFDNGGNFENSSHDYSSDLDLFGGSSVFHSLNRAKTKMGLEVLSSYFLKLTDLNTVKNRQEAVIELKNNQDWVQDFQASLFAIKEDKSSQLIATKEPPKLRLESVLKYYEYGRFLAYALMAYLIYTTPQNTIYYVLALIAFHYYLVGINKKITDDYFGDLSGAGRSLSYYRNAVTLLNKKEWESDLLKNIKENLPNSLEKSKNPIDDFGTILRKLEMRNNQIAAFFLYLFSPFDLFQFIKLKKWLADNPNYFKRIFESIADFEALTSLSTLAFNQPEWSFASFNNAASFELKAKGLGHPLLAKNELVCNDFEWNQQNSLSLITGSNMSGKSSFLRAVGINTVLAYAGAPVLAKSFDISLGYRIISYMRIKDSIQQNASTFKAEIDRIKRVVDSIDNGEKAIYLIDEMLRGTNSDDKLAGTMALLHKVADSKAFTMLATHDLRATEVIDIYPNLCKNYYFEYQTDGKGLSFDYKIKEGVCKSFNASLLLKSIGLDTSKFLI